MSNSQQSPNQKVQDDHYSNESRPKTKPDQSNDAQYSPDAESDTKKAPRRKEGGMIGEAAADKDSSRDEVLPVV